MSDHLSMIVSPGDIAVVKEISIGGQKVKLRKPLRVPVEQLGDCQVILDRIERAPSG